MVPEIKVFCYFSDVIFLTCGAKINQEYIPATDHGVEHIVGYDRGSYLPCVKLTCTNSEMRRVYLLVGIPTDNEFRPRHSV